VVDAAAVGAAEDGRAADDGLVGGVPVDAATLCAAAGVDAVVVAAATGAGVAWEPPWHSPKSARTAPTTAIRERCLCMAECYMNGQRTTWRPGMTRRGQRRVERRRVAWPLQGRTWRWVRKIPTRCHGPFRGKCRPVQRLIGRSARARRGIPRYFARLLRQCRYNGIERQESRRLHWISARHRQQSNGGQQERDQGQLEHDT
jgi:hypothetical protein